MDRIAEPVLREYFPIRVCRDVRWKDDGDEKRHRRRLIFCFHPHGIYTRSDCSPSCFEEAQDSTRYFRVSKQREEIVRDC